MALFAAVPQMRIVNSQARITDFIAWAHLTHENLLPFYGVFVEGAQLYLVPGRGDLRGHLRGMLDASERTFLVSIDNSDGWLEADHISGIRCPTWPTVPASTEHYSWKPRNGTFHTPLLTQKRTDLFFMLGNHYGIKRWVCAAR